MTAARIRSGYGAALYINEIVKTLKALNFTPKYPDRLTRAEALDLLKLPQRFPELGAMLFDKSHPRNPTLRAFHEVCTFFAQHHPQGQDGEPAPWPDRGERDQPTAENPFADLLPDEARELLEFARVWPDYTEALADKGNPKRAAMLAATERALEIASADEGGAPPGPLPAQEAEAKRAEIAELMKDAAYLDGKHPDHTAAVERVSAAYRAASPAPAASPRPAMATSAPAPRRSPAHVAAELARDPAYLDAKHPDHAGAVERATATFAGAFPAPGKDAE